MKNRFLVLFLLLAGISGSCKKSECADSEKAVLKDYKGLDGCTWIIELENGQKIEPVNLESFVSNPKDGMKIRLSYNDEIESASICMVGKVAQINCLEILKH